MAIVGKAATTTAASKSSSAGSSRHTGKQVLLEVMGRMAGDRQLLATKARTGVSQRKVIRTLAFSEI